jgi:GxxExxY protein
MNSTRRFEEPDAQLDLLASAVISACIEVHGNLGPGYTEAIYERALCRELRLRSVEFERQVPLCVVYKGERVGEHRLDLLVGQRLIVELKAIEALGAIHGVQLRSYLKARGERLGLLINFNMPSRSWRSLVCPCVPARG